MSPAAAFCLGVVTGLWIVVTLLVVYLPPDKYKIVKR